MDVLIVESDTCLADLWRRHLEQQGFQVQRAASENTAIDQMYQTRFDVIVLNLLIEGGSALAVADFAQYRMPNAAVIFMTGTHVFSDGSIFQHALNARAFLPSATAPEDLAKMAEHYALSA